MTFSINKNSTLPLLKLELIEDGRNDYDKIHEDLQNANITFTMSNSETGVDVICNRPALLLPKEGNCTVEEYYIGFKFKASDTKKSGSFKGKFKIEFLDGSGTLIVPIQEELNILVLDK